MTRATKVHLVLWPAAFALGLALAVYFAREKMDPLTQPLLASARQKWSDSGVRDYDLRYRMHGSEYEIKTRGGLVIEAKVNGRRPLTADWNVYSMDGLFDILEQDLENAANPTGPFAASKTPPLLRVRFNPVQGYVERYLRSGSGLSRGAGIELINFAPMN